MLSCFGHQSSSLCLATVSILSNISLLCSQGKILANIEPTCEINDVALTHVHRPTGASLASYTPPPAPDSGLVFVAGEHDRVLSYFIPELGMAPKWCSFLDSITEELEESTVLSTGDLKGVTSQYEDYKFVTREELTRLGLSHMIGTPMLKVNRAVSALPYWGTLCSDWCGCLCLLCAGGECFGSAMMALPRVVQAFMHGYWMEMSLYKRVQAVVDPFAVEKYRKER